MISTQLRPRVAHITTIDLSLRYLLLNQLCSLQAAGYDVSGISSPGPHVSALQSAGLRHIPVRMTRRVTPLQDLRALWQLWRVIRREQFTIVHTHNPKPGLLGQIAARLAGAPIVVNTIHGFYFYDQKQSWARWFYITLERLAARCSDVILSQSAEDLETAIQLGICSPGKIRYLGNGIDLERFERGRLDRRVVERARAGFGLASQHRVIGFVGRLVREKGLRELLEALATIRKRVPDIRLLIVGSPDLEKPDSLSEAAAAAAGVQDITVFAGHRDDMPVMYALMDVFVLPSHREGVPRSPMEASAMGVPCVLTDIRGCREVVDPGRNGLLVPVQAPGRIAEAILTILEDPLLAERMRHAGPEVARERFDERLVFDRVAAEYERLIRRGEPTAPPTRQDS